MTCRWLTLASMFVVTAPLLGQERVTNRRQAQALARQKGWTVRERLPNGYIRELQRIINGVPLYYATQNNDAADTLSTDDCLPGGSSGLGLSGANIRLGIWDAGRVRLTHLEFAGRAVQLDASPFLDNHATHVGGTMIAAGLLPAARGMSPSGILAAYDWNEDVVEMGIEAVAGDLRVSNHSYGYLTGWYFDSFGGDWYWFGDASVSISEDHFFGFYSETAQEWDQLAYSQPKLLFVKAAGNDRDEGPESGSGHFVIDPLTEDWVWSTVPRSVDGNSGYDSISHQATSKNGLTVGAVFDIPGGFAGPGSVVMTSFSCWGPTDDGRIKPDVVGNGTELVSPVATGDFAYDSNSGTSMATPNVSGSLGLLVEHYRNSNGIANDMRSSTLKALVVHTADEAGSAPGPDYIHGWGLVNTLKSAQVVNDDLGEPFTISEHILDQGDTVELTITTLSSSPQLRATLAWTDPPGTPPAASLDPTTRMLVNDLDLRIQVSPGGTTHFPWVLNPADPIAAAVTGDNVLDNVEQVVVSSPGAGTYVLRVTHKGTLQGGNQPFGLIITGADAIYFDCNENGMADAQDLSGGTSQDCDANSIPDECDIASGTANDCNGNTIPDSCEFLDCNKNCVPDAQDLGGGTSEDCNVNAVPDECDIATGAGADCNANGVPDSCDLAAGTSADCNTNGVPDSCEIDLGDAEDCNANGVLDVCDIANASSLDCNANDVPDSCDLNDGQSNDCNGNTIPDECEFADCNENCIPDGQDLLSGGSQDCNSNAIPDECDLASGYSDDLTANNVPDECENRKLPGFWATMVARGDRPFPGIDGPSAPTLGRPSINNERQVAFFVDTTYDQGIYLWSEDVLSLRVRQHDEAPGGEAFNELSSEVSLNDAGDIAFGAALSGPSIAGVFLRTSTGIETIAVHGDPVPDVGGVMNSGPLSFASSWALSNAGEIYFKTHIVGAPGGIGESGAIVRYAAGAISTVAATGVDYPETGVIDSISQGPWVSLDGTLTFKGRTGGLYQVFRLRNGVLEEVVREGDFAPGTASGFERFDDPVSTSGPIETYFSADVAGAVGHGLFKQRISGAIESLVLQGSPSPIPENGFLNPRSVFGNPLGDLYFYSQLSTGSPLAGIFKFDQRLANASSLLLVGDPAPVAGGLEVDDAGNFAVNNVGDLVLLYKATDGAYRMALLDQRLVGDLDLDDDVDITDYEAFIVCMNGPGILEGPLCEEADFDEDNDIDMDDFGAMQDAFIVCEQDGLDCNGNGVGDTCEALGQLATDCDDNQVLDVCDILFGAQADCNGNWLVDSCDIAAGSHDYNTNNIPDECEGFSDCNFNGIPDLFDISLGNSEDCDADLIPDECELFDGPGFLLGARNGVIYKLDPTNPSNALLLSAGNPMTTGVDASCAGVVWGLGFSGEVVTVDPQTGSLTTMNVDPSYQWAGAAYDCATGTLYGSTSDGPGPQFGLYRVSTVDGTAQLVGDLGRNIAGLAFDSNADILYGLTDGLLWIIDTNTGWPTLYCDNVLLSQTAGLAFAAGTLYTASVNSLYAINPDLPGCPASVVGALPIGLGTLDGLAFARETTDCNTNMVPDHCDIASGTSLDVDANEVPDECGTDCNANGVIDEQELVEQILMISDPFAPFGDGFPAVYGIAPAPIAVPNSNVTLRFDVNADLENGATERVNAVLMGMGGSHTMLHLWSPSGLHCADSWTTRTLGADQYNAYVKGASATVTMTATTAVSALECPDSFIMVSISYSGTQDCDQNGLHDSCDLLAGATDCNTNGLLDTCDIVLQRSRDCDGNQIPDECEFADCNENCVPDGQDLIKGTSLDCNANGRPDECDTASGSSLDCDGDEIPDECEADCNDNGTNDTCDITSGTSTDCNVNQVPDSCDLAGGTSQDCNLNGLPDDCEMDCNGNGVEDQCDLSGGVGQDVNGNGILDQCERPIIFVDVDATGTHDGSSWTNAYTRLQTAMVIAATAPATVDEIWVADGTYRPTLPNGNRSISFVLTEGVALFGGFSGLETAVSQRRPDAFPTILSGDLNSDDLAGGTMNENSYHVVTSSGVGATAVLDGFTITRGNANGAVTAQRVGGGMYNHQSSPTVTNCVFKGNRAFEGGGMYNFGNDFQPIIRNCLFTGNAASDSGGGGILNFGTDIIVVNCTFSGNTAMTNGGAMRTVNGGRPTVTSSILWGNSDQNGSNEESNGVGGENPVFRYNDIQGWTGAWGGVGNIGTNPLFTSGPLGGFYLSHTAAGQAQTSPCVDAGDPAGPLVNGTTRTDSVLDSGIVDMGYHYLP